MSKSEKASGWHSGKVKNSSGDQYRDLHEKDDDDLLEVHWTKKGPSLGEGWGKVSGETKGKDDIKRLKFRRGLFKEILEVLKRRKDNKGLTEEVEYLARQLREVRDSASEELTDERVRMIDTVKTRERWRDAAQGCEGKIQCQKVSDED